MITEDYVSLETAKLLKEKGFDGVCFKYALNGKIYNNGDFIICHGDDVEVGVPTIQMAMKWLRETHNLGVFPTWSQVFGRYGCRMYYLKKGSQEFYSVGVNYDTYEEACEAAIKYCLENLV